MANAKMLPTRLAFEVLSPATMQFDDAERARVEITTSCDNSMNAGCSGGVCAMSEWKPQKRDDWYGLWTQKV